MTQGKPWLWAFLPRLELSSRARSVAASGDAGRPLARRSQAVKGLQPPANTHFAVLHILRVLEESRAPVWSSVRTWRRRGRIAPLQRLCDVKTQTRCCACLCPEHAGSRGAEQGGAAGRESSGADPWLGSSRKPALRPNAPLGPWATAVPTLPVNSRAPGRAGTFDEVYELGVVPCNLAALPPQVSRTRGWVRQPAMGQKGNLTLFLGARRWRTAEGPRPP